MRWLFKGKLLIIILQLHLKKVSRVKIEIVLHFQQLVILYE